MRAALSGDRVPVGLKSPKSAPLEYGWDAPSTVSGLVVLAFVAASCGTAPSSSIGEASGPASSSGLGIGPGSASSPSSEQSDSGSGSSQLADALLPVTPIDSASGSVSGELSPDAPLVLDTVGPDGAKFHVEFAEGSAPFAVTVTMRPLQSLGGFTGNMEGVTFEPSGMYLLEPAVLTIDGPVADAPAAVAFGYQTTDAGVVARPTIVAPVDGPMRIPVTHFSGYGSADEGPPQWNIGAITASEARDIIALEDFVISNTYRQLKAHIFSDAEAQQIINNALDGIANATERLGESALKIAKAGSPDAASQVQIEAAMLVMLGSQRADQLTGNGVNRNVMPQVAAIVKAYLVGVTEHCATTHDLTVLTLLASLTRQTQLLGGADESADREMHKCTSADVRLHLTFNVLNPEGVVPNNPETFEGVWELDVTAPVDLYFGVIYEGVPYHVTSTVAYKSKVCTSATTVDDGQFSVLRARLTSDPKPGTTPPVIPAQPSKSPASYVIATPPITDAVVDLSIGSPLVRDSGGCAGPPVAPGPLTSFIDQALNVEAHGSGAYLFKGGFEIPGGGSKVLARRTIDRTTTPLTKEMNAYHITTIVEIIHTPE